MEKATCFVVSLLDSDVRRKKITADFKEKNIPFQFFDAVDRRSINEYELEIINNNQYRAESYNRSLLGGEVGCFESHRAIYQRMVENHIDWALIFEDDIEVTDTVVDLLEEDLTHLDHDAIYFIGGQQDLDYSPMVIAGNKTSNVGRVEFYDVIKSENYVKRTCSYLISQNIARKLYNFQKDKVVIADDWQRMYSAGCFKSIYLSQPYLVVHPFGKNYTTTIYRVADNKARIKNVLSRLYCKAKYGVLGLIRNAGYIIFR